MLEEKHIQFLLDQSDDHYMKRELGGAREAAEKALELSSEKTYVKGIIQSNLLLGKIHTVSARFNAKSEHFPKALDFIKKADAHNQPPNQNGDSVDIYLAYGEIFQSKTELGEAEAFYNRALDYAKKNKDKKGTIQSLCALSSYAVSQKKLDQAFEYINEALALVDETTAASIKAGVYNQLCQVYIKKQDYSSFLDYANEALLISNEIGEIEKELVALNNIAVYHANQDDLKTAMKYFLNALDKSKAINFQRNTSQSLINIATIYARLNNYKEAVNRYEIVLRDYREVIDDYTQVIVLNNLGNIYYHSDTAEKALDYFNAAYKLAAQINYREMVAHTLAQKSRTHIALKNFDQAFADAEEAQKLMIDLDEVHGKQINLICFGNLYFHKKEFDKAIRFTSQGIVTAKRMNDDETEIIGYQILAKIYQELKNFEKALDYQLVYSKAQERFAKEQRGRQIMDMEIQFAIRQKEKEIEQLTKDNEYQALLLEQSDQIANQNVQLLQVNEELRQFAYVASHDLKEPIRMIGSYTQLIQRKFKDQTDEGTASFFEFVSEGVTRMNNLLDALLKYATIGKNDLEMEEVNLNTIIEIVQLNLRVAIEETSTEIIIENDLPIIQSVQSLIIQLLQNLVSNAIKFRKEDARQEIIISSKEDETHYTVNVQDNGIGINPEFQERIFIIFQRLHTRSEYDGTGIGLAICQKIIQRLGGTISVNSQVGEGATFSFTLPKIGK